MGYNVKKRIDFSRTYRRLSVNRGKSLLYLFLFVIPVLVLLLNSYSEITLVIAKVSDEIMGKYIILQGETIVSRRFLSLFGRIFLLQIPNTIPQRKVIFINMVFVIIMLVFCTTGKRRGKPFSIFFIMVLLTHLTACIYFLFWADRFPYTATEFSELYMRQEVGIWISFVTIFGFITSLLEFGSTMKKILALLKIMSYSVLFGTIRYLFFVYVLYKFSILYMVVMFFFLGPLFDFIYFVYFYGIYIDQSIKRHKSLKGRGQWEWA